jgi:hypothetical protein
MPVALAANEPAAHVSAILVRLVREAGEPILAAALGTRGMPLITGGMGGLDAVLCQEVENGSVQRFSGYNGFGGTP